VNGQNFFYTPVWVKVVALSTLTMTLLFSLAIAWLYVRTDDETWVLVAMSVAQVSASGLVVALLVFFSARDIGAIGVQLKADQFLGRTVPRALLYIDCPLDEAVDWQRKKVGLLRIRRATKRSRTRIRLRHTAGSNAAFYFIETRATSLVLRIQANVSEITVSYYFPAASGDETDRLKTDLEWALSRYTAVGGYHQSWYFSVEDFDDSPYVSVHLTRCFSEDFLDDEREKMAFVQDVAASTRSLIKDCAARGVPLARGTVPAAA